MRDEHLEIIAKRLRAALMRFDGQPVRGSTIHAMRQTIERVLTSALTEGILDPAQLPQVKVRPDDRDPSRILVSFPPLDRLIEQWFHEHGHEVAQDDAPVEMPTREDAEWLRRRLDEIAGGDDGDENG